MSSKVRKVHRILWIGDLVAPTGFARVNHGITEFLPKTRYDIHGLGINYWGDPHPYSIKIYPAFLGQDIYGINRLEQFLQQDWDTIFMLNDVWVLDTYLSKIKNILTELKKPIPKIVTYFPIDATDFDPDWFKHFDIVTKPVVYTEFGKQELKEIVPGLDVSVIPHGVDTKVFYKIKDKTKREIKGGLYPNREDFLDSWIVLNANRNQPRKRVDIALEGFALFAEDKPENVKYYHHAGLKDMGYDIIKLTKRLGIDTRLVVTSLTPTIQAVSEDKLNEIYNATDVGINTSLGEGWGLVSMEHAATGAAQIVPNHTACKELFNDCGLLIPTYFPHRYEQTLTVGELVHPNDVATQLQTLYDNPELLKDLGDKAYKKFTSKEYEWKTISRKWDKLFKEILEE